MVPLAGLLALGACASAPEAGPRHVEVVQTDGRCRLTADGGPFYIRGAGLEFGDYEALAEHGGNSPRAWRTDDGAETIDVMEALWTGARPANRSPRLDALTLDALTLDGRGATDALAAGQTVPAQVASTDPDGDALRYAWEVRHEQTDLGGGGESVPALISGALDAPSAAQVSVTAPGACRLFVTVYDGHHNAAHANIPFHVGDY